jgi:hypothetical protein
MQSLSHQMKHLPATLMFVGAIFFLSGAALYMQSAASSVAAYPPIKGSLHPWQPQ